MMPEISFSTSETGTDLSSWRTERGPTLFIESDDFTVGVTARSRPSLAARFAGWGWKDTAALAAFVLIPAGLVFLHVLAEYLGGAR